MKRAVGSWTMPRNGRASLVGRSVGAIRGNSGAAGRNMVSFIPSGSNSRCCMKSSYFTFATTSIIRAAVLIPALEYW